LYRPTLRLALRSSLFVILFYFILFFAALVSEEAKAQARATMEEKQGTGELLVYTPDELKEHRDEELMVLESIFAEDFTKKSDTLLTLKV
jgi:hypothetical protein